MNQTFEGCACAIPSIIGKGCAGWLEIIIALIIVTIILGLLLILYDEYFNKNCKEVKKKWYGERKKVK